MGEIRQVDGPKILPRGYGKTLPQPPPAYEWEMRPYVFHEYPKAMTEPCTMKHVEWWRQNNKYTDPRTGVTCYNGHPPKLGSMVGCLATEEDIASGFADALNEEVTVDNPEEEEIFRQMHPNAGISAPVPDVRAGVVAGLQRRPSTVSIPVSAAQESPMADIEAVAEQNRLLANMLAERKELLRQLAELDAPSSAPISPAAKVMEPPEPAPAKPALSATEEREALIKIALKRGIAIDKRWAAAKIRAAIAADEG